MQPDPKPPDAEEPNPLENLPSAYVPARYEFSIEQNQTIGACGSRMRLVGMIVVAAGVLEIALPLVAMQLDGPKVIRGVIVGLLLLVMGYWIMEAGREFQLVDRTKGHDITHLMLALDRLTKLCTLLIVLVSVGILARWSLSLSRVLDQP